MTVQSRVEFASATDTGVVRKFNEDSIATDSEIGLMMLADGMGGYMAGDVASALAISVVKEELAAALGNLESVENDAAKRYLPQTLAVKRAAEKANQMILRVARKNSQCQDMGTTLTLAVFHDDRISIAHVGDSRLYRLRYDRLEQLTMDHSLLQGQVEAGLIDSGDAKLSHNRNLVTRALGKEEKVEVDVREEGMLPGDLYLLCSDGLNDMVEDTDIELALCELKANLPLAANLLVQMANDNGGHDNVSVVLARVRAQSARRGLFERLFGWFRR
ncbi:protein serine/threonine phosphatase [Sulfuricella denitrificans skB26]|uniref:Protein serine/threonine phosphatase n=1 Tax=Sulfuricella denitrificans (strain DSM 22764 / NBRC 105220 / skB26) TaxID=1163617 RepID=S6ACH9_SULDS|nr:protein phosphatase 2C domain-containing protein [Sulfuricella denitrificans]BAN35593.1 protein serine/threonine phosphatase [Sulfuricella denitrificans skB26]